MTTRIAEKEVSCQTERWPARGRVEIWCCDARGLNQTAMTALESVLPASERAAANRYSSQTARATFVTSRTMRLAVLRSYLGDPAAELEFAIGHHGKPFITSPLSRTLQFNIAHSAMLSVLAVTTGEEVGIDIEQIRENIAVNDVAELSFAPRERVALMGISDACRLHAFYACWTRKESLLKAQGFGLQRPPTTVDVGLGAYDPDSKRRGASLVEGWSLSSFDPGPGYVGAVAVEDPQIEVVLRNWPLPAR